MDPQKCTEQNYHFSIPVSKLPSSLILAMAEANDVFDLERSTALQQQKNDRDTLAALTSKSDMSPEEKKHLEEVPPLSSRAINVVKFVFRSKN
jgi:hypothetical protein